jgi:hypothetical protein
LGEVLFLPATFGRVLLLQSPSSGIDDSRRGPLNLDPWPSSTTEGLNLLPFDHVSSLSAALSEEANPVPRDLGGSASGTTGRGRLERQSLASSESPGARSLGVLSNLLLVVSRGFDSRGPSLLQGLSNLLSSSPWCPDRSLGGSATLIRTVLLEKDDPLLVRALFRSSSSSNST